MKLISLVVLVVLVSSCNRHIPGTKSLVEKISFDEINSHYSRLSKREIKKHLPFFFKGDTMSIVTKRTIAIRNLKTKVVYIYNYFNHEYNYHSLIMCYSTWRVVDFHDVMGNDY
jgi:hypothetical protein